MSVVHDHRSIAVAENISKEVLRDLQRACESSGSERMRLLEDLLSSLCAPVSLSVLQKMRESEPHLDFEAVSSLRDASPPNKSTRSLLQTQTETSSGVFYYQILADYYSGRLSLADEVQELFRVLLGHSLSAPLYALLFYRFLNQGMSTSRCNVWLRGAGKLFFADLDKECRTFEPIYRYLRMVCFEIGEQGMCTMAWSCRTDVAALTCRFFFYYDESHKCYAFVQSLQRVITAACMNASELQEQGHCVPKFSKTKSFFDDSMVDALQQDDDDTVGVVLDSESETSCAISASPIFPVGSVLTDDDSKDSASAGDGDSGAVAAPSDVPLKIVNASELFMRESLLQLHHIRNKNVLLRYLSGLAYTRKIPFLEETRVRLHKTLYSLRISGAGLCADVEVRRAAKSTMDALFPEGKLSRKILGAPFRIFYSATWPTSVVDWLVGLYRQASDLLTFAVQNLK
eukprot:ANDGO_00075.mRNA.1 hypothetical protein NAEGRDRAFT_80606